MNITELLHKRILVVSKTGSYQSAQAVEEIKILEISPSRNWVKIQNQHGSKLWKSNADITVIEILEPTDKPSQS